MYGFAWSPDGQHVASGSHLGGVMIWNVATSQQEWIGRQLEVRFPRVAWSSDGTRLAGGGDDGIVYIWNVIQGSLELQFMGHHSRIRSLAWSPDGNDWPRGQAGQRRENCSSGIRSMATACTVSQDIGGLSRQSLGMRAANT
jgi:WD40 repeat protein